MVSQKGIVIWNQSCSRMQWTSLSVQSRSNTGLRLILINNSPCDKSRSHMSLWWLFQNLTDTYKIVLSAMLSSVPTSRHLRSCHTLTTEQLNIIEGSGQFGSPLPTVQQNFFPKSGACKWYMMFDNVLWGLSRTQALLERTRAGPRKGFTKTARHQRKAFHNASVNMIPCASPKKTCVRKKRLGTRQRRGREFGRRKSKIK